MQLLRYRAVYSYMNDKTRTPNRKALILGAAAAVTLGGIGWTWAEPDATAPQSPAPASEAQPKDGPKGACCKVDKGPRDGHRFGGHEKFDRRRGGPGRFEHGPGGFLRDLKLSDEQKAKVKEIFEAQKPKIEAIRKEERAKMKAVFDDAQAQIRPLLTKEQQQVLDDAKKLEQSKAALKKDKAE